MRPAGRPASRPAGRSVGRAVGRAVARAVARAAAGSWPPAARADVPHGTYRSKQQVLTKLVPNISFSKSAQPKT